MAAIPTADLVKNTQLARARFLYGLDKVPDERLSWSPGGSAGTALQLADKLSGFLFFLSHLVAHGSVPEGERPKPEPSKSRDEAKGRVDAGFTQIIAAFESLTPELIEKQVMMPWQKEWSMGQLAVGSGGVLGYFQGQLNFLQLCYGDEDPNIPPEWQH